MSSVPLHVLHPLALFCVCGCGAQPLHSRQRAKPCMLPGCKHTACCLCACCCCCCLQVISPDMHGYLIAVNSRSVELMRDTQQQQFDFWRQMNRDHQQQYQPLTRLVQQPPSSSSPAGETTRTQTDTGSQPDQPAGKLHPAVTGEHRHRETVVVCVILCWTGLYPLNSAAYATDRPTPYVGGTLQTTIKTGTAAIIVPKLASLIAAGCCRADCMCVCRCL